MGILDDRGRLFGRINVIDAAVAFFVFGLVPLAYLSWVLFRTPPPTIDAVAPQVIVPGQPNQHLELRGRDFRPFLHANIGNTPAVYLFASPDRVQMQLPALPPGAYDLVLFDSQEIARYQHAVTVQPGTVVQIRVRFVTRPEVVQLMKRSEQSEAGLSPNTSRPVLVSYEVIGELVGTTKSDLREGPIDVVNGLVRLRASWTVDGWRADGSALKAGAPFTLTTPTYVLQGDILSVDVPSDAK